MNTTSASALLSFLFSLETNNQMVNVCHLFSCCDLPHQHFELFNEVSKFIEKCFNIIDVSDHSVEFWDYLTKTIHILIRDYSNNSEESPYFEKFNSSIHDIVQYSFEKIQRVESLQLIGYLMDILISSSLFLQLVTSDLQSIISKSFSLLFSRFTVSINSQSIEVNAVSLKFWKNLISLCFLSFVDKKFFFEILTSMISLKTGNLSVCDDFLINLNFDFKSIPSGSLCYLPIILIHSATCCVKFQNLELGQYLLSTTMSLFYKSFDHNINLSLSLLPVIVILTNSLLKSKVAQLHNLYFNIWRYLTDMVLNHFKSFANFWFALQSFSCPINHNSADFHLQSSLYFLSISNIGDDDLHSLNLLIYFLKELSVSTPQFSTCNRDVSTVSSPFIDYMFSLTTANQSRDKYSKISISKLDMISSFVILFNFLSVQNVSFFTSDRFFQLVQDFSPSLCGLLAASLMTFHFDLFPVSDLFELFCSLIDLVSSAINFKSNVALEVLGFLSLMPKFSSRCVSYYSIFSLFSELKRAISISQSVVHLPFRNANSTRSTVNLPLSPVLSEKLLTIVSKFSNLAPSVFNLFKNPSFPVSMTGNISFLNTFMKILCPSVSSGYSSINLIEKFLIFHGKVVFCFLQMILPS
ncbi:hypothetical protein GEMRC1_009137 [Eukaryota sp. GEM-RC1]